MCSVANTDIHSFRLSSLSPVIQIQIFKPWSCRRKKRKERFLSVFTSHWSMSALFQTFSNMLESKQNTEVYHCWQLVVWHCLGAVLQKHRLLRHCILLLRNQHKATNNTEHNRNHVRRVCFSLLLPSCLRVKIQLYYFPARVPQQYVWGNNTWLAKKLISKTRDRFVWITKGNNMKPLISTVSLYGKAE